MNLTERFPLLHLPDRWDWASITMRFQSQVPADRLVSSTHAVAFVGVSDADGPYKPRLPHGSRPSAETTLARADHRRTRTDPRTGRTGARRIQEHDQTEIVRVLMR
jgi:hypothetical protein